MILFNRKLDPLVKLCLKEKTNRLVPIIIEFKEPLSNKSKYSISKNRLKINYEYNFINSIAATTGIDEIEKLSELPEVLYISYNRKAHICMNRTSLIIGLKQNTKYSLTGKGITIAVIDTGVYPHADLLRTNKTLIYFKDFINSYKSPYDDNGHGTHICGIIAGSGSLSQEKYTGIAQNAKLIMLKAFNTVGEGSFSDILASIGWIIENKDKYNIRLLCLPFGAEAIVNISNDILNKACKVLNQNNIITICAAGNNGPYEGSITTPGNSPYVITAGSSKVDSDAKPLLCDFSSRGSNKTKYTKPDLLAPGFNITSIATDKGYIPINKIGLPSSPEIPYCSMSGTSMSAAVLTGCIALLLQKMPKLSFGDLQGILKLSCKTLNLPKIDQGYGNIDMQRILDE